MSAQQLPTILQPWFGRPCSNVNASGEQCTEPGDFPINDTIPRCWRHTDRASMYKRFQEQAQRIAELERREEQLAVDASNCRWLRTEGLSALEAAAETMLARWRREADALTHPLERQEHLREAEAFAQVLAELRETLESDE